MAETIVPSEQDVTKKTSWRSWLWTALPIFISVVALIVSVRQSMLSSETTASAVYGQSANIILELDKIYLANTDIRGFFYENRHLENTDPNAGRVAALAEMTLDTYEILLTDLRNHSGRYQGVEEYRRWMTDAFRQSEVLRNYIDRYGAWYSQELRGLRNRAR